MRNRVTREISAVPRRPVRSVFVQFVRNVAVGDGAMTYLVWLRREGKIMKRTDARYATLAGAVLHSARAFGVASVLLFGCLGIAPSTAKADIYDLNATVGTTVGTLENVPGYTGLTIAGTLTIDPTQGVTSPSSVTVQNDPNVFNGFFGCPGTCTYSFVVSPSFAEYGFLDLGTAPFTGNPITLGSDSYIYLTFQGSAEPTDAFTVSGALTDVSSTPEPSLYGILALFLGGVFVAARKRARRASSGTA